MVSSILRAVAALFAALAVLSGCVVSPQAPLTLRVLATPELADLAPLLPDLRADTGVDLQLDMDHGLDAVGALQPGEYRHDAAWLSSDRYFQLELTASGYTGPRPLSTSIMLSPVVVGMKRATAERLRAGGPISWADIAASAAAGEVRFGMAEPRRSGSGLAALVGVATAAADTGRALQLEDLTCDRLRGFFTGHAVRAETSAALVDGFMAREAELDALVAPESTLLSLNASGRLAEPMEIIYPADGIIQSDFPLLLLNPAKRDAYDRVVDWLLTEQVQRRIMDQTARRPIDPNVPRPPQLPATTGNALYFPDRLEVVDALLANYEAIGTQPPAHVIFVLDFSGSMRGDRIAALRAAFVQLSGPGEASFVRFHAGERITVVRFGGEVLAEREFAADDPAELAALREFVNKDSFDDRTAVWSAAEHANGIAARALATDAARPVSIVLMTDGINNAGLTADEFLARLAVAGRPPAPIFTIRFGEADAAELARVATATGGRSVDADTELTTAFEDLRGCH
ncbi:VWA domain-containing protein [Pseudonocardia alaniniphila]|uniref:VWA domain-containing protein n=1 Tax=Pseudonocardia alaniniphila TaxID=75291 RepID=A0ABS9TTJ9_9PSEU|nr:VWA domain-containing protein [Pseudonocardia alaniniphila]MCH6171884.1 VWA domain-containing protein [Pseudonocardia alaniniphila]